MIRKKLDDAYRSFSYSGQEVSSAGDWPQLQKEDSQLLKAWDQMKQRLFYWNPYLFFPFSSSFSLLFRGEGQRMLRLQQKGIRNGGALDKAKRKEKRRNTREEILQDKVTST